MQLEHTDFQDQLLRGLTHRMNNIFTLFHGYVGLLMDNQKLDAATRDGLTKIKEGARAATELMDRTHSLVRPATTVWREVDLAEMLRLGRPGFQQMCGPATVLDFHCPPDLPRIQADASRIRTAITEIIRNACEATAEGGGTVRVELSAAAPTTPPNAAAQPPIHWVTLTVSDDGTGISKAALPRIFMPFYTTKKKRNAAGLGLSVAQDFVQQHGGVLRCKSEPGRTCFEMLLPSRSEGA